LEIDIFNFETRLPDLLKTSINRERQSNSNDQKFQVLFILKVITFSPKSIYFLKKMYLQIFT